MVARDRNALTMPRLTFLVVLVAGCGGRPDTDLTALLSKVEASGKSGKAQLEDSALKIRKRGEAWTRDVLAIADGLDWKSDWAVSSYGIEAGGLKNGEWPEGNSCRVVLESTKEFLAGVAIGWLIERFDGAYDGTTHNRFHLVSSAHKYFEERKLLLRWNLDTAIWTLDWDGWKKADAGTPGGSSASRLRLINESSKGSKDGRAAEILVGKVLIPALEAPSLQEARAALSVGLKGIEDVPSFASLMPSVLEVIPGELIYELVRGVVALDVENAIPLTTLLVSDEVYAGVSRGLLEGTLIVPSLPRAWLSGSADGMSAVELERRLGLLIALVAGGWEGRDACLSLTCKSELSELRRRFQEAQRDLLPREWKVRATDGRPYPVRPVGPGK